MLRDGIQSLAIRGTGHEAETAGGVATGSAGLATKAIVVACISGSAAAGVGGACVATGVVDVPGNDGKPVAEKTVPEEPTRHGADRHYRGANPNYPRRRSPAERAGDDDSREASPAAEQRALRRRLVDEFRGIQRE